MGDLDDPAAGAEVGWTAGRGGAGALRQRLCPGSARMDHQGSNVAGAFGGSAGCHAGERGMVISHVCRRCGGAAGARVALGWPFMGGMITNPSSRPASWKWTVCGMLLLASTINYMDRQTLANAAVRITTQFQLKQEQYGDLEFAFGYAFA